MGNKGEDGTFRHYRDNDKTISLPSGSNLQTRVGIFWRVGLPPRILLLMLLCFVYYKITSVTQRAEGFGDVLPVNLAISFLSPSVGGEQSVAR